jgi:hypothetical protein
MLSELCGFCLIPISLPFLTPLSSCLRVKEPDIKQPDGKKHKNSSSSPSCVVCGHDRCEYCQFDTAEDVGEEYEGGLGPWRIIGAESKKRVIEHKHKRLSQRKGVR